MTSAELLALITLRIEMGIAIPVPPATYTNYIEWEDISDYAGSLSPGESVKTVMKILSPVGIGVYENPGYAASDFSDPDYPTHNPNEAALPLAADSQPVNGVYQFLIKAQFDDGVGNTFVVQKTISSLDLCPEDQRPTVVLTETYSCEEGTFTSTDSTAYGNNNLTVSSIVREHTVAPPYVSGQSPTTVNATVNEVGDLWTGTYEAQLKSTVTYVNGNNYFVYYITGSTEITVVCDSALCVLFCCLRKVAQKYYEFAAVQGKNSTEVQNLWTKMVEGTIQYFLAKQAQQCGQDTTPYVTKFYQVTGCDPTCDDCADAPAPVVPTTTTLQGADGTDGLTAEFQVTGTVFQWKYTTEVTWNDLIDFSTLNLTPDFTGYNYQLLVSDTTNVSTSAVSVLQTLKTNTIDFTDSALLCPIVGTGDYVTVKATFTFIPSVTTTDKTVYVNFGSTVVTGWVQNATTGIANPTITIELTIYRTGANSQDVVVNMDRNAETMTYATTGTENWASVDVSAQAYIGDASAATTSITITDWVIETHRILS